MKDVSAFVSDLSKAPKRQFQLVAIQQTTSGPVGVGTTYRTAREPRGSRPEGRAEIIAYQLDSTFGLSFDAGPVQVKATVRLRSAGTGAKLSLRGEGKAGGMFKLAEGALAKQINGRMEANLSRLKTVLEAPDGSARHLC